MIKTITNRLFLLVTMLLLSTVNALAVNVAKIGSNEYATLAEAIAAVSTDGTKTTITMLADETVAEGATLTIATGKNIVLDLNGKTIAGSSSSSANSFFFITNNGTLEITDDSEGANGKITYASSVIDPSYGKQFVTIYNPAGTLTLTNGMVENLTNGGASYAVNNSSNWGSAPATFNMNGGKLSAPKGDGALRVYQNCAATSAMTKNYVNITGGTIVDTGIFIDAFLSKSNIPNGYNGSNIDTKINITGGTVNGLIDMKIRHPFNTLLTISGNAKLTNAQLRVRKNTSEYVTDCGEPNSPMVNISGTPTITFGANNFVTNGWTSYSNQFSITGGTYNVDPSAYVADGYKAVANGNDTWTVQQATAKVAQIGNVKYATLQEAFNAAQDGDIVTLLADYDATGETNTYETLRNLCVISSITIDGDGHTLTVNKRGVAVKGLSSMVDVTFKDINIVNTASAARCIDTRGNIGTLTLDNVTLSTQGATSGYTQPLTIGGNQATLANVIVKNGSVIQTKENGTAYYAIITFNPVNMTIEDSTIKGWACIYAKGKDGSAGSAGSTFTINNSTLVSSNAYSGVSNSFAAFVMEDNNVTVNVTNSEITLNNTGNQVQAIAAADGFTGAVVNLGEGNEVTFVEPGNFAFALNDAEVKVSGGEFNAPVPEDCCAEGYVPTTLGNGKYGVKKVVAQIGSVKYETLAEAFAAATSGQTITLLADCETGSNYDISKPLKIAYIGTTLDLNGKTLTVNNNFSFCVTADNVTIKNGTIASAENTAKATKLNSYILVIGGGEKEETISGVTIENVTTRGGISVGGSSDAKVKGIATNTVIKDCDVLSGDYYAVCSQNESTVTINGGQYTANTASAGSKVLQACFTGDDGPEGTISVVAGTFTGAIFSNNQNLISITGGTYSVDPSAFVAEGYEAVAKDDKWTVGKIVVKEENLSLKEVNEDKTEATYTVSAIVQDDGEEKIGDSTQAGKTVTVEIAAENNAATGAKLDDLNIANVLTKAITTEAAAGQNNINVSIAVVANDETATAEVAAGTVVFEVHPEATVTVNNGTPSTVKLANSDLAANAEFTFTLDVTGKFDDGASIQVVHKSDEFGTTTLPELLVVDGGKVTISEIKHFSSFQLSEVVPVSISAVGFATFSSDKAVDFTGIDAIHAYTAVVFGDRMEFTRIYKVPANTGLLIRNPSGAKAVTVGVPVIENFEPGENDYYLKNNALVAVTDKDIDVLSPTTGNYSNYILNKVGKVVGFYRPAGYGVAKGRAYLQAPTASNVQSFTNLFDGETTAIDSITTADEQTQDNVFYDLSGRRVNNPQRGLYIVNGKKVLVK